jgi:putative spermidine/putrescine transport system permease protein
MQRSFADLAYAVLAGTLAGVTMLLLLAPTAVVLIISFTGGITLKFPPPSWSIRWYSELLQSAEIIQPAITSLKVATLATVGAAILGTAGALGIARSGHRLARVLDALFMSPMVLPAMAFGLSLLMVFNLVGIRLSITTLVLGHIVVCVPFVIRMVGASLQQLDPQLANCSLSLGASRWYTFRRITLPLIQRGIFASCFVAFLSSFDNVPVSLFLADARTEVLPIKLWAILEGSLDVRVAAVSGLIVITTLAGLVLAERLGGLNRQIDQR